MTTTLDPLVTQRVTIELPDTPQPSTNGFQREAPVPEDKGATCAMCEGPMSKGNGGAAKKYCSDACKQARYRRDKECADLAKRKNGRAHEWEGANRKGGKERPVCACGCGSPVAIGKTLKYLTYASDNCKHRMKRRKKKAKSQA